MSLNQNKFATAVDVADELQNPFCMCVLCSGAALPLQLTSAFFVPSTLCFQLIFIKSIFVNQCRIIHVHIVVFLKKLIFPPAGTYESCVLIGQNAEVTLFKGSVK